MEARAFSRAGVLGNPSDGYGGKAIAVSLYDFFATARVEPSERLCLAPGPTDGVDFSSLHEAVAHLDEHGCDDGLRLLRAALARFTSHWPAFRDLSRDDPRLRFRLSYETTIPRQVGLAGSSAIVIATLRALARWFDVELRPFDSAELALRAELEDLGVAAGAMDRVIQSYEGFMVMDLREPRSEDGYRRLDPESLPPVFVAWNPASAESSGGPHGDLRARWLRGDPEVLAAVEAFRALVDRGVACLEARDPEGFRALVERNFELRTRIYVVGEGDRAMVAIAREQGGVAKLCGSGGAVLGFPGREADLEKIEAAYRARGFSFIRPLPRPPGSEGA